MAAGRGGRGREPRRAAHRSAARADTTDQTPLQWRIDARRPAGHPARGADERRDPRPGAARRLHGAALRADLRGALRAGALRAVLPHRGGLRRRRRPHRRPRRAGAADQRRRGDQPGRRGLHRQDRHADQRAARAGAARARSAAATRRAPRSPARHVRPSRRAPPTPPPPRWPRTIAAREPRTVARRGGVPLLAALERVVTDSRTTATVGARRPRRARAAPADAAEVVDERARHARARPRGPAGAAARPCADGALRDATTGRPRCRALARGRARRARRRAARRASRRARRAGRARASRSRCISGDDPDTVAALARRAGLAGPAIRGPELAALDPATLRRGRRRPHRVRADRARAEGADRRRAAPARPPGRDGRRRRQRRPRAQARPRRGGDALAAARSPATSPTSCCSTTPSPRCRPPAPRAGASSPGSASSMYLFLARVATQMLVILTVTLLGLGFPYTPTQVGLTLFTVGLPTFFLTLWARPTPPRDDLLVSLARFVLPVGILTAGFATADLRLPLRGGHRGLTGPQLRPEVDHALFESTPACSYGVDADFVSASATLGAQSGLSVFVSATADRADPAARAARTGSSPRGRRVSPDRRPRLARPGPVRRLRRRAARPGHPQLLRADRARPARHLQIACVALVLWFVAAQPRAAVPGPRTRPRARRARRLPRAPLPTAIRRSRSSQVAGRARRQRPSMTAGGEGSTMDCEPQRALVADDGRAIREALARALELEGYEAARRSTESTRRPGHVAADHEGRSLLWARAGTELSPLTLEGLGQWRQVEIVMEPGRADRPWSEQPVGAARSRSHRRRSGHHCFVVSVTRIVDHKMQSPSQAIQARRSRTPWARHEKGLPSPASPAISCARGRGWPTPAPRRPRVR